MRTSSGTRPKSSALAVEVRVPQQGRAFAALANKLTVESVFVSTFHTVPEGTSVVVEMPLAGDGPVVVVGQVLRAPMVGAAGFAVMFHNVSPGDRARILAAAGATTEALA
jgi:hypothetical protein